MAKDSKGLPTMTLAKDTKYLVAGKNGEEIKIETDDSGSFTPKNADQLYAAQQLGGKETK